MKVAVSGMRAKKAEITAVDKGSKLLSNFLKLRRTGFLKRERERERDKIKN